ncbi:MAG: carbohydrate ABC transporter permease [Sulfolobaceae archaeon]|nr:carbohydrate ABC transporter permease [Sulfolobaceae archaeon]
MNTRQILIYIGVIIFSIYFLFPLYILILVAFNSPKYTIFSLYPSLLLQAPTLSNLIIGLTQYNFVEPFLRSLGTATLVGVLSIALGIPAGLGLSRLSYKIAYPITLLLLITNMMPSISIAVPIAAEFIRAHLFNTIPGLALAQTLITLPLATFILEGTFSAIPLEIEYQARLDGASVFQALWRILIPMAAPGIVAAFLISWMFSWDEFTFAVILMPITPTLPVEIYYNITRGDMLAAVAFSLIFTIPVVVITLLLQKYLRGEYLAGGIKR